MVLLLWLALLQTQSNAAPPEAAGIIITTRNTTTLNPAQELKTETTMYLQRDRKRVDYPNTPGGRPVMIFSDQGPPRAYILRCDLGQYFNLNLEAREYEAGTYQSGQLGATNVRAGLAMPMSSSMPRLRMETATSDTGERKEMFGHTARHVITTYKTIALDGSQPDNETVVDGWYTDLNTNTFCEDIWAARIASLQASAKSGSPNITMVETGKRETGFVLEWKMTTKTTMYLPYGEKHEIISESETRVTKLEEKPLDPALFEVPADFRRVDSLAHEP